MVFVNIKKIDCVKINKKISYYSKKNRRFIMKAKMCIGILSLALLTFAAANAQRGGLSDVRHDNARVVVNNYHNDYDYYFTSRINRFHRSYAAFDYYSPVFTDSYWYDYRPFSLGLGIYGGLGFGLGFNYDGSYNSYDQYYGSYWGYDPYYYNPFYNSWYSPLIFNFSFGNRWHNNYYGWNNNYYNHNRYDYRSGYYSHNDYHNSYSNMSRRNSGSGFSRRPGSNGSNGTNRTNGFSGNVRSKSNSFRNASGSGNLTASNYRSYPNVSQGSGSRSGAGITSHSTRSMSSANIRSSSPRIMGSANIRSSSPRSMNPGSSVRSSSTHSSLKSSGRKSSGRR
jgi:hypothetical protein